MQREYVQSFCRAGSETGVLLVVAVFDRGVTKQGISGFLVGYAARKLVTHIPERQCL
jgi:hypothetical protein